MFLAINLVFELIHLVALIYSFSFFFATILVLFTLIHCFYIYELNVTICLYFYYKNSISAISLKVFFFFFINKIKKSFVGNFSFFKEMRGCNLFYFQFIIEKVL